MNEKEEQIEQLKYRFIEVEKNQEELDNENKNCKKLLSEKTF